MKAVVFYSSDYRTNTEKIAELMASQMNAEFLNIRDLKDDDYNIDQFELIGFGSGVYREDLSKDLYRLADRLNLEDKKVFVF